MFSEKINFAKQYHLFLNLLELYEDNSFKISFYKKAELLLKKIDRESQWEEVEKICLASKLSTNLIQKLKTIFLTGTCEEIALYLNQTPPGILELLKIRGLGVKKVKTLWKSHHIDCPQKLYEACTSNQIQEIKGFGKNLAQSLIINLEFYFKYQHSMLWHEAHKLSLEVIENITHQFKDVFIESTGHLIRYDELINELEFCSDLNALQLKQWATPNNFKFKNQEDDVINFQIPKSIDLKFYYCQKNELDKLFKYSCSEEFYNLAKTYKTLGKNIPVAKRDQKFYLEYYDKNQNFIKPLEFQDIKGLIHCHSTWSDGTHSIENMALTCIQLGFEYMVITDHSQSAIYAKGLKPIDVLAQHQEIDVLNKKLAPFKIFKGIESDILADGSLDYEEKILKSFDVVIASVHNQLEMAEEQATLRVLKAIENPYTTILGHCSGRVLLKRDGFKLNYPLIFEACVKNKVVVEMNTNNKRLDLDWRYVNLALEMGVMLSLNPDAHSMSMINDLQYGINIASKTLLIASRCLSCYGLKEFENYLLNKIK
ncbi:MAG: PHP domain-containing protein [Alphaproteobacteria bacterium]|nr:PHP domain-containing protein [Alphaproteobacteria bacterium]